MIVISKTKSLKQPYIVKYTGKNNEVLATSEMLKSKKACWKNIYAMAKNFNYWGDCQGYNDMDNIAVKDLTVPNPEVFVYDLSGIKKKAGVRR